MRDLVLPRTSEIVDVHKGVRESAISGTRWVTISQIANQATRLLTSIGLARLLVPEDFGLMAMVGVVTTALDRTVGQNITGSAVIHRPGVTPEMASSVFALNIGVGIVIGAGIFFGAPALAWVVGDERTADLFRAVALLPIVTSWGYIHRALLRRSLRFGRFAAIEYSHAITNAAVAIPAALAGLGVWSLVAGSLAGAFVSTVASWVMSPWRPVMHFSLRDVRQISGYSANLGVANLAGYSAEFGDRFVIGRFVGAAALGFYNVAFRLLLYPVKLTSNLVLNVLFPVFARMDDDARGVARGFVRAAAMTVGGTLPAMVGLALLAEPFVIGVLGPTWAPAVPLVQIIALAGPIAVLGSSTSCLYYAKGRTGAMLGITVASSVVLLTAYAIGAQWGAAGVAWGYLLGSAAILYPQLRVPLRTVGLEVRELLFALWPSALSTAVMAGVVAATRAGVEGMGWGHWPTLTVCVPVGVAVYVAVLVRTDRRMVRDFMRVVRPARRPPDEPDGAGVPEKVTA